VFYEPDKRDTALLPHDPFKAIVAPRPIGWISTVSAAGIVNLAPYSFFNAVASRPNLVMFASEGEKDSVRNIRETGEFVANHVSAAFAQVMNLTSVDAPSHVDEFEFAGLEKLPSRLVRPPRVAGVMAALECRATMVTPLPDKDGRSSGSIMVVGEVVGVHIDEAAIRDGRFDFAVAGPVTRMGYMDYLGPQGVFQMVRPRWEAANKR